MRKLSLPLTVGVAVAVYVVMFALLPTASDIVRLMAPALLALLAAGGMLLATSRTPAQITDDAYRDDAHGRVRECLDLVDRIRHEARGIRSPSMQTEVQRISQVVPELLRRVEAKSPNALYSSASQLHGHLSSLAGVVATYGDIEQHPQFYDQPEQKLVEGERALGRFTAFALDSIRLVNQGDVAAYQANLATVAPPDIPTLLPPNGQEHA